MGITWKLRKRMTYVNCSCGNMNEVNIVGSIHNRVQQCSICKDWVVKDSVMIYFHDTEWFLKTADDLENFALSWG